MFLNAGYANEIMPINHDIALINEVHAKIKGMTKSEYASFDFAFKDETLSVFTVYGIQGFETKHFALCSLECALYNLKHEKSVIEASAEQHSVVIPANEPLTEADGDELMAMFLGE